MHLKVAGDCLLEKLAVGLGLVPEPLVQVTFGPGQARATIAGVRLGLFEALSDSDADPAELATRIACSPPGTQALANCLVGAGLLERRGGRYSNAKGTRTWLLSSSPKNLREAVIFLGYCQELLVDLEEQVRTGEVVRLHDREHPPAFWDAYMGALASFAKLAAKEIVPKIKVKSPRKLLDVGGGHGLYAAALCRKHPGLEAEVLDLPGACAAGRPLVEAAGLSDRVRHREGDFREVAWGEDHDLVLLFNVLHNATEAEARDLLHRAKAALAPGGQVVICDAVHRGVDASLDLSAGWNELFFFLVSGAQAWPEARLRGWLEEAGFRTLRRSGLMIVPNFVLCAGA